MTLEALFSQAAQGRTFLLLTLCGAAAALLIQLAGFLHRLNRLTGMAADLLCVLCLTAALARILLESGSGLRLYGLLGLCIGAALYTAGLAPAVRWIAGWLAHRRSLRSGQTKAGNAPPQ